MFYSINSNVDVLKIDGELPLEPGYVYTANSGRTCALPIPFLIVDWINLGTTSVHLSERKVVC